jgi:nucleotide-binding universal stress UspA family protein
MIDRVLVPMDDSALAERALRYALEAHPGAEITVLHVVGEPSAMMGEAVALALEEDVENAAEEAAEEILSRAREIAAEYDVEIQTDVGWGAPAKAIVSRAEEFDAVVLGSHAGSIAERVFVGDVAKTVFRRSPVPVTVVR